MKIMIKVFLVEDEVIRYNIDWEREGFEFVGKLDRRIVERFLKTGLKSEIGPFHGKKEPGIPAESPGSHHRPSGGCLSEEIPFPSGGGQELYRAAFCGRTHVFAG